MYNIRGVLWEARHGWTTWGEVMPRIIRWPIAVWMNRYSDTCWAELVMWAVHPAWYEFGAIFEIRHTSSACGYCGKECTKNLITFAAQGEKE